MTDVSAVTAMTVVTVTLRVGMSIVVVTLQVISRFSVWFAIDRGVISESHS